MQSVCLKSIVQKSILSSILQNIVLQLWSKSIKYMHEENHYFSRVSGWRPATFSIWTPVKEFFKVFNYNCGKLHCRTAFCRTPVSIELFSVVGSCFWHMQKEIALPCEFGKFYFRTLIGKRAEPSQNACLNTQVCGLQQDARKQNL